MKLLSGFRYAATFVFFLLLAAPAFAQFEVSPDHFDENTLTTKKAVSMKKQPGQINSRPRAAVGKASTIKIRTSKTQTRVSVAGTGKPSPRRKSGTAIATTAAGTHKARPWQTSLKAQASAVHLE